MWYYLLCESDLCRIVKRHFAARPVRISFFSWTDRTSDLRRLSRNWAFRPPWVWDVRQRCASTRTRWTRQWNGCSRWTETQVGKSVLLQFTIYTIYSIVIASGLTYERRGLQRTAVVARCQRAHQSHARYIVLAVDRVVRWIFDDQPALRVRLSRVLVVTTVRDNVWRKKKT